MGDTAGSLTGKDRNEHLWRVLRAIRQNPGSDSLKEDWAYAAIDLTRAVFSTQFASLRDSADREDLEQSAVLEFHRGADKLALLTDSFEPDNLFRILYSVAKFSMLRELSKLKRHLPQDLVHEVETARMVRVENLPDEEDACHPVQPGPDVVFEEADRARFVTNQLPLQILDAVDRHNLYRRTRWGDPIKFVALQRLRGKFVSSAFVRSYWKPPNPDLVVTYGDFLARSVVLAVASVRHRRVMGA